MTAPFISLLPQLTGSTFPAPNVAELSDDEQALVTGLSSKLVYQSPEMLIRNSYYEGTQRLFQLGISIPPQLAGIRTVVDWPRICIDPLVQRCVIDGFRLPGEMNIDSELQQHWEANEMDYEAPLAFLDSFVYGRSYMIVGAPDTPGDSPVVTVESPLNMTVNWDPRTRSITSAYQAYEAEGVWRAVLYLPDQTVTMSRTQQDPWQVDDRDVHNFGQVPVVRFVNRARPADREGRSEITPAVMNTTDSACRSLLGMEIAREFYSIPHRYILGATESDYVAADGTPKTALDMVMSKFLAFERDDSGEIPTVGQFTAFDPSVFTKIIDEHGQLMSSYTQFPPEWFAQTTTANPASADAIRSAQDGVNRRAQQAQRQFAGPLERVQGLVWRFANNGAVLPDVRSQIETDWVDVATATPTATSQALAAQEQMGAIPATADAVLKKLGWTSVERAQFTAWRKANPADEDQQEIAQIGTSLETKDLRTALSVAKDIAPPPAPM